MSYDIELVDPVTREPLKTPDDSAHHIKGGTYQLGGKYLATTFWRNKVGRKIEGQWAGPIQEPVENL